MMMVIGWSTIVAFYSVEYNAHSWSDGEDSGERGDERSDRICIVTGFSGNDEYEVDEINDRYSPIQA